MKKITLLILVFCTIISCRTKQHQYRVALAVSSVISRPGYDKAMRYSCEAMIDHVNRFGGINGNKIGLVVYDDGGDPEKARDNARTIAGQHDIIGVVGYVLPECLASAREVYDRDPIAVLTPVLTESGILGTNSVFRATVSDVAEGNAIADYAAMLGARRVFIIAQNGTAYSNTAFAIDNAAAGKFAVAGHKWFEPGEVDFANLAATVRNLSPDTVVIAGNFREAGLIVSELKPKRANITVIGTSDVAMADFVNIASVDHAENVLATTPFIFFKNLNESIDIFNDRYAKLSGRNATWVAFNTYEAMGLILHAAQNGADRGKIIDTLRARTGSQFLGLAGTHGFDEKQESTRTPIIVEVKRGKWAIAAKQLPRSEKIY
ncbi:MAG: ABC transporter substrate-binding protein [Spirochaetota bacterium]